MNKPKGVNAPRVQVEGGGEAPCKRSENLAPEVLALALKIQGLAAHRRYLVEELVEQLRKDVG